MENIIQNGEEVLVFHTTKDLHYRGITETKFIKGVVVSSRDSEDLNYHGSEHNTRIYTIIDEDGRNYEATHNNAYIGPFYIRTVEEQISILRGTIANNYAKMRILSEENETISNSIKELISSKEKVPTRKIK